MRSFTIMIVVFGLGIVAQLEKAQAGFEFMAPKVRPKVVTPLSTRIAPPIPVPYRSMAVPMKPVVSAPLVPIAPVMRTRQHGLIINPYPLNTGNEGYNINNVSSGSVNRALIEASGLVTPMNLGAGMRTGAQVDRAKRVLNKNQMAPVNVGSSPTSLVPIPGLNPLPVEQQRLPTKTFHDAVGFGKDIPLSIALSQIVPTNFNAKLPSASLGDSTVSWEGGKPWNQVLDDVLMPLGYRASIQGSSVIITPYLRG